MTVELSSGVLRRVMAEARASPEREVCGLLFGSPVRIDAAERCANVAADPARVFELDPAALVAAHRRAREGGARVVGVYHSHPSGRAAPSRLDAEHAAGDDALWLIVAGDAATLWRAHAVGAFEPMPFQIVSGP